MMAPVIGFLRQWESYIALSRPILKQEKNISNAGFQIFNVHFTLGERFYQKTLWDFRRYLGKVLNVHLDVL